MSSSSKQTKLIRRKKVKPNKSNLKKDLKRIQKNAEILKKLESAE